VNKNDIIIWLWNDKNFNQSLNKICPDDRFRDDLRGEFFIILSEKDESEVQKMYNNKYLLRWSVSVLKNQYHSNTSPFYKKYRNGMRSEYDLDMIVSDENEYSDIVPEVERILDSEIHWFDAHIFKLYYFSKMDLETGEFVKPLSTRKIEELHKFNNLKIDHTSVHKSVKRTLSVVIEKLKQKGMIENGDINRNS
jgi:hypothetical protein